MSRQSAKPGSFGLGAWILPLMMLAMGVGGCTAGSHQSDVSYLSPRPVDLDLLRAKQRPPTAKTLHAMARILAAQGKDEECGLTLERIIREHPGSLPAYCELAELHLRHHRVDDAIVTLLTGLDISPTDPILLNDLGMCWMLKKEHAEALQAFTMAASAKPQNSRYRANMAASLGMMGRYDEALALYKQVIPTPDAYFNLSVLCDARNDVKRAREEYDRARAEGLTLLEQRPEDMAALGASEYPP